MKHYRQVWVCYSVAVELIFFFGYVGLSITNLQGVMQNISRPEVLSKLKSRFERKLNYTELYHWEYENLNWTDDLIPQGWNRDDPIEILEHGKGKCGEFANVYVAICLVNGYQARLVSNIFGDHEWVEVKVGEKWIHVDTSLGPNNSNVFDHPYIYEGWKNTPLLLVAVETSSFEDVTANYRTGFWINILSWQMVTLFLTTFGIFTIVLKKVKTSDERR